MMGLTANTAPALKGNKTPKHRHKHTLRHTGTVQAKIHTDRKTDMRQTDTRHKHTDTDRHTHLGTVSKTKGSTFSDTKTHGQLTYSDTQVGNSPGTTPFAHTQANSDTKANLLPDCSIYLTFVDLSLFIVHSS